MSEINPSKMSDTVSLYSVLHTPYSVGYLLSIPPRHHCVCARREEEIQWLSTHTYFQDLYVPPYRDLSKTTHKVLKKRLKPGLSLPRSRRPRFDRSQGDWTFGLKTQQTPHVPGMGNQKRVMNASSPPTLDMGFLQGYASLEPTKSNRVRYAAWLGNQTYKKVTDERDET